MNIRILSGSALKIIAMISMVCDHVAKYILAGYGFARAPLLMFHGHRVNLLYLMVSVIGRIAFPLFAFLVVEGYLHTRNLRKYVFNLLLFAVLTVVPWNLLHGSLWYFHSFNVLFTFALGILAIYGLDRLSGWKTFFCVVAAMGTAYFLKTDYGFIGVLLMILLYEFRSRRELQSLSVIACLFNGFRNAGICLSILPILMYNGERGFIRGKAGKYFFYAFYPLHFLIIYYLKIALF